MGDMRDVLSPGGKHVLFENLVDFTLSVGGENRFWSVEGIYRADVSTGKVDRAAFEPRLDGVIGSRAFAASPDATRVLIAENWNASDRNETVAGKKRPIRVGADESGPLRLGKPSAGPLPVRVTLSLARFDVSSPREIETFVGAISSNDDHSVVQWSPDGEFAAVALWRYDQPRPTPTVEIFETHTWSVALHIEDAQLAGSASWGPDSDRLLVRDLGDALWIQHMDGSRKDVTTLPIAGDQYMRPIRPLGMADNDHLLTLRIPADRATIMRTSIADGTHDGVLTWECEHHSYPVIAQMPPETWNPN